MKILSIGNSFSQDATRYLQDISGHTIFSRNCYIPGCSLEMHWNNICTDATAYDYEENASPLHKISIKEALLSEDWDAITIQQVSHLSGMPETYEPYFGHLLEYIQKYCPRAQIILHRTWAYEIDSTHDGFENYGCDQEHMYHSIVQTTAQIAEKYALPVIGVGDAIQALRKTPPFNYLNGGISLCRDSYHLTYDYGRYAAGLVWCRFFGKTPVSPAVFHPEGTEEALITLIQEQCR